MRTLYAFFVSNRKALKITFEVFWILVFVLDMTANQTNSSIPQFVYVNF